MIYVSPMHAQTDKGCAGPECPAHLQVCDLWSDDDQPLAALKAFLDRAGLGRREAAVIHPLYLVQLTLAERFIAVQHGAKALNQDQARRSQDRILERSLWL